MEKFDSQTFEELKRQIQPLILRLQDEKRILIRDIASALNRNQWTIHKWAQGKSHPAKKDVGEVVKKLKKLVNDSKDSNVSEMVVGYAPKIRSLVCIYFPTDQKTGIYKGSLGPVGVVIKVNGMKALIAYPNDSIQFEDADGLVPMVDPSAEPSFKYESLIAIKKIDIKYCRPGNLYYIFDKANQPFLRVLFKEKEKYRLVAENSMRFPDLELAQEEIAVVFKVIISVQPAYRMMKFLNKHF